MKINNKKGFTIVELVIVIAVIAILAGVLIPTFSGLVGKAQDSAVIQEARNKYTEYVGLHDYSDGTSPAQNIVIEVGKGNVAAELKFVIVKGGKLQDKVYKTLAEAKEAAKYKDENGADAEAYVLCDEHVNVLPEGTADTLCDDCKVCLHSWTDSDAKGTECTNAACKEKKPTEAVVTP